MIELTIPYLSLKTDQSFLRIKQWVFRTYSRAFSKVWIVAFYIHVFTAIFSVLAGFTQFFKRFLWKKTHRNFGKLYIVTVLVFAAPTGLIMGGLANGGVFSIVAFVLLSILWWLFTFLAYRKVRMRQYEAHAKYMYLSYALTLSAITLRAWKFGIVHWVYPMQPMDLYRLVAWLGWVPNLLIAIYLISRGKHKTILSK
jgi:hypothetical protein